MKICMNHWNQLRQGIEDRGMGGLIGNAETLKEKVTEEVEALQAGVSLQPDPKKFDPLFSANNYVWGRGLEMIGLAAMNVDDTPGAPNDGHVCPLCEARKSFDLHNTPTGRCSEPGCTLEVKPGDKPWDERMMFDQCLDPMRAYCIEQGLIAQPS